MLNQPLDSVILIDDDQKMLSLLTTLLKMEGYLAVPLISPRIEKIINAIDVYNPIAIVLDVHLADQDGIEILKSIHSKANETSVSILMTSGEDLRKRCLDAGADEFLLKPYMPTDLIDWLEKKKYARHHKEG